MHNKPVSGAECGWHLKGAGGRGSAWQEVLQLGPQLLHTAIILLQDAALPSTQNKQCISSLCSYIFLDRLDHGLYGVFVCKKISAYIMLGVVSDEASFMTID